MKKKIIIWLVIILVGSNLPIINKEILRNVDAEHFRYSNADASFTYIQHFSFKQPWMSESTVQAFIIEEKTKEPNREVFRLYRINPLCFWRWSYYLSVSRKFRYKSWDEIEPNREPYKPDNVWQQF